MIYSAWPACVFSNMFPTPVEEADKPSARCDHRSPSQHELKKCKHHYFDANNSTDSLRFSSEMRETLPSYLYIHKVNEGM